MVKKKLLIIRQTKLIITLEEVWAWKMTLSIMLALKVEKHELVFPLPTEGEMTSRLYW